MNPYIKKAWGVYTWEEVLKAVAEEREACAEIADEHAECEWELPSRRAQAEEVAKEIRKRGKND